MKKIIIFLFTMCLLTPLFGDEPLLPPETYVEYSHNKEYSANVNYKDDSITVYEGKLKKWAMKGWYRPLYLSDSGEDLVITYWGYNLLSLDYKNDEVMFCVIHKGELKHIIRLNDIIFNYEKLRKTASHYYWGNSVGFIDKTHFLIETVEDNKIIIDIVNGSLNISKKAD